MNEGLIQKAQQTQQGPGFDHSKEIQKMVSVMPPELRKAFEQVVKAGQTIMYSPETREEIMQFLTSDAPIEERLGMGIANLVIMIDNKANGSLPKEALIPAATVLLFDAADVLKQSGEQISAEQVGMAYEMMFYGIFEGYGIKGEQADAAFSGIEQDLKSGQPAEDDPNGEEPPGMEDDNDEEMRRG
jgi:hypothetical protein